MKIFIRESRSQCINCEKKNTVCCILTADCLPVLIANEQGTEVAAIHAGWRSLASGVIENTLAAMVSPAEELMAFLGPAISQQHFEVGGEVKQAFCDGFDDLIC